MMTSDPIAEGEGIRSIEGFPVVLENELKQPGDER